jgi:hypothetical protein
MHMTYPQQPGNWSDPSWPAQQPQQQPYTEQQPYAEQQPYVDPTSGAAGYYGAPASPAGYPASPAAYPAYGYGGPVAPAGPGTNGMAIASLVVSLVALAGLICYGVGGFIGVVGAILGHVAKRQIRERGESGGGMATAGVVMGWIATGLAVLILGAIIAFVVYAANHANDTSPYTYPS